MTGLRFSIDEASVKQIEQHLLACASGFRPSLVSRVSIPQYSAKLASRAVCYEAWCDLVLVGLIAIYMGRADRSVAFITNASVHPDFQRRGIARRLLADALQGALDAGMKTVELEVDSSSIPALELYAKAGFEECAMEGATRRLRLNLRMTE